MILQFGLQIFCLLWLVYGNDSKALTFSQVNDGGPSSQTMAYLKADGNKSYKKLKVGVVGLVHTHVHWILGRQDFGDIEIVGIVEPNRDLAERYAQQHGYSMDLVFETLEEMVEKTNPSAVTAFNTIYDHLEVVEYCAPRGIHVMVEKPMAVSWEHAKKMAAIAQQHDILLLTNYETSWYNSHWKAYEHTVENPDFGEIRKMTFNTGHPGPIEIGCNIEFLDWLTDPVLNGGGALTDFGCYGANLATWFLKGEKPLSVFCTTNQLKPDKYPKVDDDATIILDYEGTQVLIRASWNWSHNRKDTEVYGVQGYVFCHNQQDMTILDAEKEGPYQVQPSSSGRPSHDPFAYLNDVINEEYQITKFEPSSLENNLIVMQILELAKKSAASGQKIFWADHFN